MSTLAEAKAELGYVQARQEVHKRDCPCRNWSTRLRRTCEERSALEAEARRLRGEIKTWFSMPDNAERLL